MKATPLAAERVSFEQLLWISGCIALTLLPGVGALPVWVTVTVAALAVMRLALAFRGRETPHTALRFVIGGLAISLLFLQFHTFNGLTAGSALLSLIAGLKLMETRTRRDIYVITLIIYFLSLAALLEGESFWLLAYLIGVCWLTTSTLLRLTGAGDAPWRRTVRHAGRILLQALPLALVFWLFFPRFGGPLWQMPENGNNAMSGLGDRMSPGDITDLAMSDEVAFRVRFAAGSPTPPEAERYWRGPVLHDFDGRAWRRVDSGPVAAPPLEFSGAAYRYTVSLEPHQHNWIFVLDWPSHWDLPRGMLTSDYMLVEPVVVAQPIDVTVVSFGRAQAAEPLSPDMRRRDTRLPAGRNPRTAELARQLRARYPGDVEFVNAVLAMFREESFYYTLQPPPLGADSVDGFLFDTRRGFCGHYASAFAALLRAAGIPSRIVTGYQGGTYNRFADYWILRQSDAHAWDEVWLEGRGWTRVDPTSAVAPSRVEHGLNDLVAADAPLPSRWEQRTPWLVDTRLRLDALRLLWRERILRFDQNSQEHLLELLHIPEPDGQKLALVLALGLGCGMAWLTWQVRRELEVRPRDAAARAYERFCRRLERAGIARRPGEGPEAFGARAAAARPELAAAIQEVCRAYSALRYEPANGAAAARRFSAAVRAFRGVA